MASPNMARLALTVAGMGTAGAAFYSLAGWERWIIAPVVFLAFGMLADFTFRRTASSDEIRADLAERTRNPPA